MKCQGARSSGTTELTLDVTQLSTLPQVIDLTDDFQDLVAPKPKRGRPRSEPESALGSKVSRRNQGMREVENSTHEANRGEDVKVTNDMEAIDDGYATAEEDVEVLENVNGEAVEDADFPDSSVEEKAPVPPSMTICNAKVCVGY